LYRLVISWVILPCIFVEFARAEEFAGSVRVAQRAKIQREKLHRPGQAIEAD